MHKYSLLFVLVALVAAGCTTKVTRMEPDKVVDFSGGWNDIDARLVAQEMIKDCLAGEWVNEFTQKSGRPPVVIVGAVKNRTFEHIDPGVFIADMEQALTNSGKVTFVASKDDREEVRAERADQQARLPDGQAGNTAHATISPKGLETGADFMVQGSVNSIKDAVRGKYAVFYQVTLELVDLKTNQKRWIGQKEIKKVVERSSLKP
ncbi:MAG: penicillin-binding protein activator LpoB [Candidatus Omnitrophota bacterium]|nr:penicillin-binding protein activator LpoB [Candidatus Omnitrophota bacterium]